MEITNREFINIIGNEIEKVVLEKINNESINIIGNKKEKVILDKTNNESINITGNKKEKPSEIFKNESVYILGHTNNPSRNYPSCA